MSHSKNISQDLWDLSPFLGCLDLNWLPLYFNIKTSGGSIYILTTSVKLPAFIRICNELNILSSSLTFSNDSEDAAESYNGLRNEG